MPSKLSVYKLNRYHDDPRFEGFSSNHPRAGSFPSGGAAGKNWRPSRLASTWVRVRATGRVRRFNDYPCLDAMPAFSPRAVEALREFLESNGELLPFKTAIGTYFAFNVMTVANVLNLPRSKIDRLEIWRYEFFTRKLKGLSIFRLAQWPYAFYVTDGFVARAREYQLQGMHFQKVWPLPRGVDWWRIARDEAQKHRQVGIPHGRDVKAQSVVVDFRLLSPTAMATAAERVQINKVMDQFDALLVDPNSDQPAIGSVEGYDQSKPGKLRLILSCPDADALVAKLRPQLKELKWVKGFIVRKKSADFREWSGCFD